jgi:hypothetical protein
VSDATHETWKPIPGFDGWYEVSDLGRVLSHRPHNGTNQRILRQALAHGYPQVTLRNGGHQKSWFVHLLVMRTFVGPCPPGQEVRHGPGGKQDNRLSSLCYGTRAENIADRIRDGGQRKRDQWGQKNPRAKLTMRLAGEIRDRRAAGDGITAMAREYGVGISTIKRVISGECWDDGRIT